MNASSRRLALCLIVSVAVLVASGPATAGAVPRARTTYPQRSAVRPGADAAPLLTYYGGHVLSHVKVDVVVWDSWSYGKTVPLTGTRSISSFFTGITASKYLDWLSEYDTPTQHIGRGHARRRLHGSSAELRQRQRRSPATQIGAALRTLIDAGQAPEAEHEPHLRDLLPIRADDRDARRQLRRRLLRLSRHDDLQVVDRVLRRRALRAAQPRAARPRPLRSTA